MYSRKMPRSDRPKPSFYDLHRVAYKVGYDQSHGLRTGYTSRVKDDPIFAHMAEPYLVGTEAHN